MSKRYLKGLMVAGMTLVFLGNVNQDVAAQRQPINRVTVEDTESIGFTYNFCNPEIIEKIEGIIETEAWEDVTVDNVEIPEVEEVDLSLRGWESVDMNMLRLEEEFNGKVYVSLNKESFVTAYSQMDKNSAYVGKLFQGAYAEIVQEEENWYLVKGAGFEGYVQKSDVLTGIEAAEAVAEQLSEKAVILADVLNIRNNPSADADVIEMAVAGESFVVKQEGNTWCEIVLGENYYGYVASNYVSIQYNYGKTISAEEEARIEEEKRLAEEAAKKAAAEEAARKAAAEEAARKAAAEEAARKAAAAKEQARLDAIAAQAGLPAGSLKSLGMFRITHYCACTKCTGGLGITASGTIPAEGRTIAVDPRQIGYGTTVVLNGHAYVAEDCGGGIGSNCIDVYVADHNRALQLGCYYQEIFVRVR